MQLQVEETGKLKRKISVEVPLKDVAPTYEEVFASMKQHIRVDGFRPGKFPRQLAEKRFKEVMEQEATRTLLPKYFEEALKEMDARPATQPSFTDMEVDREKPFKFVAEFEVVPEFTMPDPSKFKLDVKEPTVSKKEMDERIEKLRRDRASLRDKGDEKADKGDTVTVDYVGKIDGVPFDGGTGNGHKVQLGAGQFLEDFEKPLLGMKPGEAKSIKLTFPDDYDPKVAGQKATFDLTVTAVETHDLPEMNEAFFSQFGDVKDEEGFLDHVKNTLIEEQEANIASEYQLAMADQIKSTTSFDVPEALVEQNVHNFVHKLEHDDPDALKDEKKLEKLKKEEAEKIRDELRLSYVIDEWAKENKIEVDRNEIQQRFFMQAYMMRQNPTDLIKTPYGEEMEYQITRQILAVSVLNQMAAKALAAGGQGSTKKAPAKKSADATKSDSKTESKAKAAPKKSSGAAAKGGTTKKTEKI